MDNQKILDLPLKKEWYDMIESGEKTEEYREIKPYWCKRLLGQDTPSQESYSPTNKFNPNGYTHIRFRYGYTKRTMLKKLTGITIGYGRKNWGAPKFKKVFILRFKDLDD